MGDWKFLLLLRTGAMNTSDYVALGKWAREKKDSSSAFECILSCRTSCWCFLSLHFVTPVSFICFVSKSQKNFGKTTTKDVVLVGMACDNFLSYAYACVRMHHYPYVCAQRTQNELFFTDAHHIRT